MDFGAVVAFLLLYYVRPQEWIDGMGSFRPVLVVFIVGIVAMIFRSRGFSPKSLVKTPHDWVMLVYFFWMALATASAQRGWSDIPGLFVSTVVVLWSLKNLMGFYFVVSQSLFSRKRLEQFMWVWLGMILLVSILAVASEFGIDVMDSYSRTHGRMQGRLILNNGLFLNPNELGHSVIFILPLIYLLCIWKRSAAVKQGAFIMMAIPLYCVYLTKSKGAYLSGAFMALVTIVFGRPKFVQILVITLALTGGVVMIKMLPRMSDLRDPRSEEGIQGRLAAFFYGYECFRHNTILGKGNFQKSFEKVYGFPKASHSAYNQIGAELGQAGLFLYLATFYCALKTLILAKTRNVAEERLRRVIMAAVAGFMMSCWMIDFAYHGTFFFLMACVAAFHRLMLEPPEPDSEESRDGEEQTAVQTEEPSQTGSEQDASQTSGDGDEAVEAIVEDEVVEGESKALTWNRYGVIDFVWCFALLYAAFRFWKYIVFSWGK